MQGCKCWEGSGRTGREGCAEGLDFGRAGIWKDCRCVAPGSASDANHRPEVWLLCSSYCRAGDWICLIRGAPLRLAGVTAGPATGTIYRKPKTPGDIKGSKLGKYSRSCYIWKSVDTRPG